MEDLTTISWQCHEGHAHQTKYKRKRLENAVKTRRLSTYCPECSKVVDLNEPAFRAIEQLREQ
jgi:hypothetical protein